MLSTPPRIPGRDADFRKEQPHISGDYHHHNLPRSFFRELTCTLNSISAWSSQPHADELVQHIDLLPECPHHLFRTAGRSLALDRSGALEVGALNVHSRVLC